MPPYITATDLAALLACDRLVFLNYHGDSRLCLPPSAYDEWIAGRGRRFEAEVIAGLRVSEPRYHPDRLEEVFGDTLNLMRQGAPFIYHGVLIDGDKVGIPDLLKREEGESLCGSYYYRPIDIKFASQARLEHTLQVLFYIALLEVIQGRRPEGSLWLRLPPGERPSDLPADALFVEERVTLEDDDPDFQAALHRLARGNEPRPFISATCKGCRWRAVCLPIAERSQDVSLIPGITRQAWQGLHERGLGTLPAVAAASVGQLIGIRGIGEKTAPAIINQARALVEGRPVYLDAPDLPEPADSDVFFDVESYPLEGIYYLFGALVRRGGEENYVYELARHPSEERQAWELFLRRIERLSGAVYHYGSYERTAVKALLTRYGDDPRAQHLLKRLIDLERVLKASVALPLRGYSLKEVAPWLGFEWTGKTQAADDSMLAYDAWLRTGEPAHLDGILHYNEDDVRATAAICDWLRSLA